MTEELKQIESTIKRKHSFNFTPKYEEVFETDLNKTVFVPIAVKTFEKLGWDVVYQGEDSVEAKRKNDWDKWTEKITVQWENGKAKVRSVSLGNEFWDYGRNSKRVGLFIYAFQQTEKEFDVEALEELEREVERANNWDDYEVPETLPQPGKQKAPQFWIPLAGGMVAALMLGYLVAFLSTKGFYIIGLFEVGIAFAIGFSFKFLIKAGNYSDYKQLNRLLIAIVVLVYLSNQYFQYQILRNEIYLESIGFLEFIKLRIEAGLTIESLNTGWIGLLLSWVFQLGFTYLLGTLSLGASLTGFQLERVPMEAVDFAAYHLVKGKTEVQVRAELSKMGWREKQDQDEVFEAIGAVHGAAEWNRME